MLAFNKACEGWDDSGRVKRASLAPHNFAELLVHVAALVKLPAKVQYSTTFAQSDGRGFHTCSGCTQMSTSVARRLRTAPPVTFPLAATLRRVVVQFVEPAATQSNALEFRRLLKHDSVKVRTWVGG